MDDAAAHEFHTVCRIEDVPAGGARMFLVGERMIGVFNDCGNFFALANECPHGGASLAHGILECGTVRCRIHHWEFSKRDGRYLNEDLPQYNARVFPVRIFKGEVQVGVDT